MADAALSEVESGPDIQQALTKIEQEISLQFADLPQAVFFERPAAEAWSPAEHLVHLNKSVKAVASGLKMPKIALLAFGRSKSGSQTLDAVHQRYLQLLAEGGRASGPYVPPTFDSDAPDLDRTRQRILDGWASASSSLREALADWSEEKMDRYRMPHPLLGKLTVREMLFFTIFHNRHHLQSVRDRLV